MASPLLTHCPPGLPRAAYVSPDWYDHEGRAIWSREWVCAGRLADLPPGTIRPLTIAGAPVILCRTAEGEVAAWHNTCRHRGAELCAAEGALGKLIRCPYHAWAYAAGTGRLVATGPATPTADFRRDDHGLYHVKTKLWKGFLFLSLNSDPGPLTPDMGLGALDNWPMDGLVTGHRMTRDLACNWKVFWENYNECLHCPGIHPELVDMVPVYGRGVMSPEETTGWTGTGNLKPGAQTWTMDGQPCGPVFPGLTEDQRAAGFTFVTLYPTMYVVAHVDYVRAVRLEPTGPETTRLTAEWYFPAETLAQPGFDAARVAAFATIVIDQDGAAAEMNQRGLRSPAYARATLMPQEFDIARFHAWVMTRLETTP
jgi:Rieske 2Fe-2S family protein